MKTVNKQSPNQTLLLLLITFTILTISSCKKETATSISEPTVDLLTESPWVFESFIMDVMGSQMDVMEYMDDCEKDNSTSFTSSKKIIGDEGATKCYPSDPQTTEMGTWRYHNNKTQMIWSDENDSDTLDIVTLTATKLKLTHTSIDPTTSETYTHIMEYRH